MVLSRIAREILSRLCVAHMKAISAFKIPDFRERPEQAIHSVRIKNHRGRLFLKTQGETDHVRQAAT